MQLLTAFVLGLLTILDPCTLFTSLTAIGYIDKEISNRRKVLSNGLFFVLGKLTTYILLSIPFIMGAQTTGFQHLLEEYGEPVLATFMLLCGIVLLATGRHRNHCHKVDCWWEKADNGSTGLWSFIMGIIFSVAFCPHRLIYFITMVDMTITLPSGWSWLMPVIFGLGTGLPIMLVAWVISYSAIGIGNLTHRLGSFEKWFRYICAALFLGVGIYLCIHIALEHGKGEEHHHSEHIELPIH